jgi:hypothetical protein
LRRANQLSSPAALLAQGPSGIVNVRHLTAQGNVLPTSDVERL